MTKYYFQAALYRGRKNASRWESIAFVGPPVFICSRVCSRCRGDERGITMAAIVIFSSSVLYKYKSRICSCATIIVFLFIVLSLLTPFFVISNAGGKARLHLSCILYYKFSVCSNIYIHMHILENVGIWMKNRMHAETPDVHFSYKYLLLAEVDPYEEPVVCTTFKTYKENEITDRCTLIKVGCLHYSIDNDTIVNKIIYTYEIYIQC